MSAGVCDLTLDPKSFRTIADLAYRESGLTLVEEKASMIQSRLRPRLRILGLRDFAQYSAFVGSDAGTDERKQLISALTTNVTHFFRENHHFKTLEKVFDARLPELRAGKRMRIWSEGCSNGQEAYSAAMTLLERCPKAAEYDLLHPSHGYRPTSRQLCPTRQLCCAVDGWRLGNFAEDLFR